MKNQYVGDVRDFAKYGILKQLAGTRGSDELRLGIVWYLTENDQRSDGGLVPYLAQPEPNAHSQADAVLFRRLGQVVRELGRDISQVQAATVLPADTVFYEDLVLPTVASRAKWFQRALEATKTCAIVFLDPDNGLANRPLRNGKQDTAYATLDEVAQFVGRGQSVIVIQFFHRLGSHAGQVADRLRQVAELLPLDVSPFGMRWRRGGTALLFVIVPASADHALLLRHRAEAMSSGEWSQFFGPPCSLAHPAADGAPTRNASAPRRRSGAATERYAAAEYLQLAAYLQPGEWTTYGDLSLALRGDTKAAMAVGQAATRYADLPYLHRVLRTNGLIPLAWRDGAGNGPDECRRRLEAEGVRFTGDKADPARHVAADVLEARVRSSGR